MGQGRCRGKPGAADCCGVSPGKAALERQQDRYCVAAFNHELRAVRVHLAALGNNR
jgi:hypothetical protein